LPESKKYVKISVKPNYTFGFIDVWVNEGMCRPMFDNYSPRTSFVLYKPLLVFDSLKHIIKPLIIIPLIITTIVVTTGCILSILTIFFGGKAEHEIYLMPTNYIGPVLVIFDQEDGQPKVYMRAHLGFIQSHQMVCSKPPFPLIMEK